MKRSALLLALAVCACNPNKTVLDPEFHPIDRGWGSHGPMWSDEFNGTALDSNNWVTAEFCGGYNGELQCYVPGNISVTGGQLHITAESQKTCGGTTLPQDTQSIINEVGSVSCNSGPFTFTSARIHTRVAPNSNLPRHGWLFGRIEIRARLPYGTGTWPAFWMLPMQDTYGSWPRSGEIDIMEAANLHHPHQSSDYIQSNIHLCDAYQYYHADSNPPLQAQTNCTAMNISPDSFHKASFPMPLYFMQNSTGWQPDLVSQFHTYAMEWSDWDMRFFVDNQLIGQVLHGEDGHNRAPFRHGFYLIMNLAIGGGMTGTGSPDPSTWLPGGRAELVIDWVRVYTCFSDPLARDCIYQGSGLGD